MTVIYSWQGRGAFRRSKMWLKIVILAVIIFYIIPKLLTLLWDVNQVTPNTPNEQLMEKPLRVEIVDFVKS